MLLHLYARCTHRFAKYILILSVIMMAIFISYSKDIRFNNQFSALFSVDNTDSDYHKSYREVFGADDAVLMAVIHKPEWDSEFFKKLQTLTKELNDKDLYLKVSSVTNSSVLYEEDDELIIAPAFDIDFSNNNLSQSVALARDFPSTSNRLISNESPRVLIVAQLANDIDRYFRLKPIAEDFQQSIDDTFSADKTISIDYPGIAFTRVAVNAMMLEDVKVLIPTVILVISVFIFALFRHVSFIFITLYTSLFAVKGTLAMMNLLGDNIDQLTVTFPVLLMVIVVANCIHFYHRYVQEMQQHGNIERAITALCIHISRAAFLSCVTTAIGFYALLLADMSILRSFGFYLGSGVLFSFLGLLLIVPPALLLLRPKNFHSIEFKRLNFLTRITAVIIQRPYRQWVIAIGCLLLVGTTLLARNIDFNYHLSDLLSDDHQQVKAGQILDQNFSGSLPLEISMQGPTDSFRLASNLARIKVLEEVLIKEGVDPAMLSLATLLQAINYAFTGDDEVPGSNAAYAQLLLLAQNSSDNIVPQLVNDDFSHTRIQANISDIGSVAMAEIEKNVLQQAAVIFKDSDITVHVTGEVPLIYAGMNLLSKELIQSVLFALVVIVLTIWAVFKDWRLALSSIFPNALPIMLGLAFYSVMGKSLNPLPGIAFCIALGIAVDDTVHLFSRLKELQNNGKTTLSSIVETVYLVKGALFSSSLILFMGFMVFLLSSFTWSMQLGLLGGFLIIAALLADLIFTPAILAMGLENEELTFDVSKKLPI